MLPCPEYKINTTISFTPDLLEAIDEACQIANTSRSDFVRHALETYLKHFKIQAEKIEALAA
jgi:metal-responsive CopG/Arc/MetJ family transcriptional regulator